jgi:hypothetical protein
MDDTTAGGLLKKTSIPLCIKHTEGFIHQIVQRKKQRAYLCSILCHVIETPGPVSSLSFKYHWTGKSMEKNVIQNWEIKVASSRLFRCCVSSEILYLDFYVCLSCLAWSLNENGIIPSWVSVRQVQEPHNNLGDIVYENDQVSWLYAQKYFVNEFFCAVNTFMPGTIISHNHISLVRTITLHFVAVCFFLVLLCVTSSLAIFSAGF